MPVKGGTSKPTTGETKPVAVTPTAPPKRKVAAKPVAEVKPSADDPLKGKWSIDDATKGLPAGKTLVATIETDLGKLECTLFPDKAPITVANFVGLARGLRPYRDPVSGQWVKKPFYDGLIFHRVIPSFMIQGGDIKGNGTGEPGYTITDERNAPHKFDRGGVLAMANRGPNTAGSQFFITEGATPALDDGGRSGGHYQIFGQCEPADLVKKIAAVPRDGRDKPFQDVTINKVTIQRGNGLEPASKGGKGGAKPAGKSAAGPAKKAG